MGQKRSGILAGLRLYYPSLIPDEEDNPDGLARVADRLAPVFEVAFSGLIQGRVKQPKRPETTNHRRVTARKLYTPSSTSLG